MRKDHIIAVSILILSLLLFSYKAGDIRHQFTGDENFYFQSCKDMIASGDWLTPRYYGKPRFQKPILYYWLVASSMKLFGTNWIGARFPSILLASLIVMLIFLMVKAETKRTYLALISAIILATTFKFFKYAHFAIPDMSLLFFVTASFYFFAKLLREDKRSSWFLFIASMALATLIKGPIGLIIPALSITLFFIISKRRISIKAHDVIMGLILYFAIVLPWFIAMLKIHGDLFTSQVWVREIAHRVLYKSDTKEGIEVFLGYLKSLLFYIPIIYIRFLPWSIFLPFTVRNSIRSAKRDKEDANLHLLSLSWFVTVFLFFTLMGEKHSQYMLSLTPPFAMMIGLKLIRRSGQTKRTITPLVIATITIIGLVVYPLCKPLRLNNTIISEFASKIYEHGLFENDKIAMGSHELIPQQLEVYVKRPVERLGGKWYDPEYHKTTYTAQLGNFFKKNKKAYCIIAVEDYKKYILPGRKQRLKIIHTDHLWKRRIDLKKADISLLLKGKINKFLDNFKREYYLVVQD